LDIIKACPRSSLCSTSLWVLCALIWLPLIPRNVYAADAEHPVFKAFPFAQGVQLRSILVLAGYFGYQRSMSSLLILFAAVVCARRADMWLPLIRPYVYAADAEHPLFEAFAFVQRVQITSILVLAGTLDTKEARPRSLLFSTPLCLLGELTGAVVAAHTTACLRCGRSAPTVHPFSVRTTSLIKIHTGSYGVLWILQ
jgi:hypothetical protein